MAQNLVTTTSNLANVENVLNQVAFENITTEALSGLIANAQLRGIEIQNYQPVQDAINRFLIGFHERGDRYSARTMQSIKSAWERFDRWCLDVGACSLPASVGTAEIYIKQRGQLVHRNTLAIDRWAISRIHKVTGCPDPTNDELFKGTYEGIVRNKVQHEETVEQAAGFHEHNLDQLVDMWRYSESIANRRDLAIMAVAYESMLRAQELARVRGRHIKVFSDGTGVLTIPITKTNHSGEPDKAALSRQAVSIIIDYLSLSGRKLGEDVPLFGKVNRYNKPSTGNEPLSVKTIERVFARVWEVLGLQYYGIPCLSGHSARVGAAQDLAAAGFNALQIMQAGRWASERMVIRYCRDMFVKDSAMAIRRAGKV